MHNEVATAAAGPAVTVTDNGTPLNGVIVNPNGSWQVTVPALTLGNHLFTASSGSAVPASRNMTVESADAVEDFEGCQLGHLLDQSKYFIPYFSGIPYDWRVYDFEDGFPITDKFNGKWLLYTSMNAGLVFRKEVFNEGLSHIEFPLQFDTSGSVEVLYFWDFEDHMNNINLDKITYTGQTIDVSYTIRDPKQKFNAIYFFMSPNGQFRIDNIIMRE